MSEYDHEPIRGLPGDLPQGERILWQGAPDWRAFARTALFTRWVSGYFAVLAVWALATGHLFATLATIASGFAAVGLLTGFAVLVARTSVYTITDRRIVLRIGVALSKCINLPLGQIGSADLRAHPDGTGDIALVPSSAHRLGYAMLWPHVRPFRFASTQPMLRAVPDVTLAADVLAKARAALGPTRVVSQTLPAASAAPGLTEAAA